MGERQQVCGPAAFRRNLQRCYLIDAVESRSQIRGTELTGHTRTHGNAVMFEKVKILHLRFQRTFPSFVSSKIIPRSASSFRMRSEAAKSRRARAAWRS